MDNISTFGIRLKKLRLSLELSQKDFAETISISAMAISTYESGSKSPSIETVLKIAQKYNISIDWLCGLTNQMGNAIETYSDLYNTFFLIEKSANLCFKTISRESALMGYDGPEPYVEHLQAMYFDNPKIGAFLEEWEKMKTLHDKDIIDDDVYSLWIEKTLNKEENVRVKLNGNRYEFMPTENDGLPFD